MSTATPAPFVRPRPEPANQLGRLRRVLCAVDLNPARKFGSLEEQLLFQAQEFKEQGSLFYPLFLCPRTPEATAVFDKANLPAGCLDLRGFHLGRLWQAARLIRRERIEVVHWNFTEPLMNPNVWGLSVLTPRVGHYFTDHISRPLPLPPDPGFLPRLCKGIMGRRYARLVCVSRFVEQCLERQRCWSNLVCCRHFVNTDRFVPDPVVRQRVRKEMEATNHLVLLTVANLIAFKGIDVVLRALTELPGSVRLWVIGDGKEAAALRELAHDLGVIDRVRFLGLQSHVEPYMQAADCFVCPSRWAEAAGLVNLEALACGLPVIASDVGGISEYVADGENAWLFPANDISALADRVRRFLAKPELCQQMGRQARALAVRRFSWESRRDDYLALYQQ